MFSDKTRFATAVKTQRLQQQNIETVRREKCLKMGGFSIGKH